MEDWLAKSEPKFRYMLLDRLRQDCDYYLRIEGSADTLSRYDGLLDLKRRIKMIWSDDISFDGFQKRIDEWYKDKDFELCDPPVSAQFALDLIFKTLVDDKEHYSYLTTMPESTEQTNSIMLSLILRKYSRKYRKFVRRKRKEEKK